MYVAIKNKICALNILTWEVTNSKSFDEFDKITKMKINKNEKQILCAGFNGVVMIIHAFTLEILIISKSSTEFFNDLDFYENENYILEVFDQQIRFMEYQNSRRHYEAYASINFSSGNSIKSFDNYDNVFLFG